MDRDSTPIDDVQLAAATADDAACPPEDEVAAACAAGAGGAGASQAQDVVTVVQPPDGGEIILPSVAGEVYDLRFDPRLAEVRVSDVDGDGDLDMVLVFNAGTAQESHIVFKDMVAAAQGGDPPLLLSGATQIGADVVVQQAQALAGELPTLETAAPAVPLVGTGATHYDDDLGTLINLLNPQGVIPPVSMTFPSLEPTLAANQLFDMPTPQAEARIGAGARFDTVLIKEDASGVFDGDNFLGDASTLVNFSAVASDGVLTTIVITGFDNVANWSFDLSQVEAAVLDLGGTFNFDGVTLTIDLTGLGQTAFSGQFAANPPEDSDVDLGTLTIVADVVSDVDPGLTDTASGTAEVLVDAILDDALELGADGSNSVSESAAPQVLSLNLDSSIVHPFAGSGDGGADTDGSESITVILTLDEPLPAGASLGSTAGSVTPTGNANEYAVTGADIEAAVDGLQVTLAGGVDGTISGSLSAVSREANTPQGTVAASGAETDTSDNVYLDSVAFTVTVTPGEVSPEAAIGLPSGVAAIKEDSTDNVVQFSAQSGDATDELSSVVIDLPGVAPGDLDVSQIESEAGVSSVVVSEAGGTTTITVTFDDAADLTSFSSSFTLDAPVEDSDVDLTGVTITANAKDATDGSQTGSGSDTITIVVDAVLDEGLELGVDGANGGAESAAAQTFSLNLDSSPVAPFAGSGDGGADTDGSETTVVLLTLDAPLPADATLGSTAGTVTPTGNANEYAVAGADLEAAVDGLQVTVPAGFSGTISGSLSTTSGEANTPEGTAAASGDEPDETDNLWTDSVSFAVTVTPGDVSPEAAIGLPSGVAAIKEDSTDNLVQFSAQSGDATDQLTTVVIDLPNVLSGDVGGFDFGADAAKVASVDITDDGTDTTVTITLNAGVETLSGSFLLDAPVEDSDVDLTGVTITANAQDITDNSQTGSGSDTITIVVDAVLDEAPQVTQAVVPEVNESTSGSQTILLGLDFAMADAGFAGSLAGGSDTDASESVTSVTISLSDGTLVLDAGYAGNASLTDDGGGNWTLAGWSDAADLEAAVEALSVTVGEGFDGTVTGSIATTTREANTPESTVPASGGEPDTSDNVVSNSYDFSLVVDSVPTAGNYDIAVDEDDLPAGNSDVATGDDLADPSPTVIAGTLNFDFGADSAGGSVDFAALDGLAVVDTGSNPVTSGSVALVYDWNAATNTLTALAGATPVFTVVVTDPSTGAFTFSLLEPVDHPTAGTEDNLAIAMAFTATDGDGDTASGTLTLDIDDDSPVPFSPEAAEVVNQPGGGSDTADLDADGKVGADQPGTLVFSGGSDGDLLMGSIGGEPVEALVSDGHHIILTGYGTGTLTGYLDENDNGVLDGGETTEVIRIDLMPGTDTYTVTLSQMIANGEQIVFDDFSGIHGNNNVFFPLNSSNDPSAIQDLLITATVPGTSTVNTDNDDIGSGDQWLNNDDTPADGEIIRLDYVEDVAGNPNNINTLSYAQHYVVNDAGFRLNQLQGNSSISRSVLVRVYDENDNPQGSDFATSGAGDPAEQDDITSARVEGGDGVFGASYDGVVYDGVANVFTDGRLTFTFNADGSVTVDGLLTHDQVFVSTDDGFTQMEIQNVTSGGNLGVAVDNFLIGVEQTGDPIDISSEVTLTDHDGDAVTSDLDITLVPNLLVVGSNASDVDGQQSLHTVANPDNALSGAVDGSDGNDVLIGDPGGVVIDGQFNIAIAVDVTGSIGPSNIVTLNAAVESLVQQIIDQDIADKTVIHLITFAVRGGQDTSGLEYAQTFTWDGSEFVAADSQTLATAIDDEVANPNGNTDFEPALQNAADFFNGLNGGTGPADDDVNRIFFMTDGQDNSGPGGDFDPAHVPDIYGASGLIAQDDLKIEVFGIQSFGGSSSGFDANQLNLLDDGLPPQPGEALHAGEPVPVNQVEADIAVVGFDDLGTALSQTLITTLSGVGGDEINGGDRDEVIFGDVPNTDALAVSEGIALSPGSGWFVFQALEDGQGSLTPDWDRSDTISYLRDPANWSDLIGDGRGEGDTIDGGAGDDVILGQGGDDLMTGGPGADTFVFNLGADEGSDTITDFDGASDRLHFTDVIDGAGNDIQDVNDMIASIGDDGSGDVQVTFTSGTSIDFHGVAFVGQLSIAEVVDTNAQVVVDHA